jgi:hypothetical protein
VILIGITGAIGHGKSSLADAFLKCDDTAIHNESSLLISEFANKAKKTIPDTFDVVSINEWLASLQPVFSSVLNIKVDEGILKLTDKTSADDIEFEKLADYIKNLSDNLNLRSEEITESTKPSHRALLQWLGGYFVNHISRTIWYDELVRRARVAEKNGCKLYVIGGLRFPEDAAVIKKAGGIIIDIYRPEAQEPDLNDPTERERANITYDIRVINNGSLDQLNNIASTILNHMNESRLEPSYLATINN